MENETVEREDQHLQSKRTFRRIGFSLFAMMLTVIIVQVFLTSFIIELIPGIAQSPWIIGILIGVPFYLFGFPIFYLLTKKIPDGPKGERKKLSVKRFIVIFFISMGGTYIFNIVGNLINMLISSVKGSDIVNPLEAIVGGTGLIPTIIFIGILSPILEEIVFRGILLDKLRRYRDRTAIFFTAFAFALFHGNLSQFFYAFVLGLIFAYVTIRTNTIRYAIILHILVNLFGSVIMPALALSGDELFLALSGLLVIGFIVIGLILFIKNFKKIELEANDNENYIRVNKKIAYGNIGMILFYIVCLGLFTSAIMV